MVSRKSLSGLAVLTAFGLTACVSTQKVAVQQPQDLSMSCQQIQAEFAKLDAVMQEADDNKGVNVANVAAVVLFWPAAVGNYLDADKAEKLVERRRSHLMDIYTKKQCASL